MIENELITTRPEQTRCSKCGGREFLDKDRFGYYTQCLVCGHLRDLGKVIGAPARTSDEVVPIRSEKFTVI
jgi:hypothetical protein